MNSIAFVTCSLVALISGQSYGVSIAPVYRQNIHPAVPIRSYIVVLKEGHEYDSVDRIIDYLNIRKLKALKKFITIFRGFSAVLNEEMLNMIRTFEEVEYIEEDLFVEKTFVRSWGLDRVDQRDLPLDGVFKPAGDGAEVDVYVVDTGIRYDHEDFGGRAHFFFDVFGDSATDNDGDCEGHGTHVSGTIGGTTYGIAKKVTLWGVRALNCDGQASYSELLASLEYVAKHGTTPSVINMSLAGDRSISINLALASLSHRGFTVVVSAGNDDTDACDKSPASSPEAITVASTDKHDIRSGYSNYGECVDLFAPGEKIHSDYSTSSTSTAVLSGTSMSAPHVSGVAALTLQANATMTPKEVKNTIICSATPDHIINTKDSPDLLVYNSAEYEAVTFDATYQSGC
ncbi:extracellular serine proteinase-like [Saccoglossus kowalevskii]|uniref:Proteinase R-like n=1 Tax=Saccoglossus kowalevskii TaxID=10224 RepID=A0ABM0GIS9_SACKO|nr:PREDICTED: proteinase R-like [Saccoglossus kowalevskii]